MLPESITIIANSPILYHSEALRLWTPYEYFHVPTILPAVSAAVERQLSESVMLLKRTKNEDHTRPQVTRRMSSLSPSQPPSSPTSLRPAGTFQTDNCTCHPRQRNCTSQQCKPWRLTAGTLTDSFPSCSGTALDSPAPASRNSQHFDFPHRRFCNSHPTTTSSPDIYPPP